MNGELNVPSTGSSIDRGYLDDLTGGDHEFVVELMDAFLDSTPPLLHDLERAVDDGDTTAAAYASHTLKGSCRSIGAVSAASAAASIEGACREGDVEAMRAALPEFSKQCRAALFEAERIKRG